MKHFLLICCFLSASLGFSQNWQLIHVAESYYSPNFRGWSPPVYDPIGNRVLAFYGDDDPFSLIYSNAMFEWTGLWNRLSSNTATSCAPVGPNHPSHRHPYQVTYDSGREGYLTFSGVCGGIVNTETWLFTDHWQEIQTVGNPGPKMEAALGYLNGDVILHGDLNYWLAVQTWHLKPDNSWIQGPDGPRLNGHAIASLSDRIVVFGGALNSIQTVFSNETYIYDGAWRTANPAVNPPAMLHPPLATDTLNNVAYLYDGTTTWLFDPASEQWQDTQTTGGPTLQAVSGMVYDSANQRLLLLKRNYPDLLIEVWALQIGPPPLPDLVISEARQTPTGNVSFTAQLGSLIKYLLTSAQTPPEFTIIAQQVKEWMAGEEPQPQTVEEFADWDEVEGAY